jgi:hypothetical protein
MAVAIRAFLNLFIGIILGLEIASLIEAEKVSKRVKTTKKAENNRLMTCHHNIPMGRCGKRYKTCADCVLDTVRKEVEALPKTYPFVNHIDMYVKEDDVRRIIDKHKAESEDKDR